MKEREKKRSQEYSEVWDGVWDSLSFPLHLSAWGVFQSTRSLHTCKGSPSVVRQQKKQWIGFSAWEDQQCIYQGANATFELLAHSPNSVSAGPRSTWVIAQGEQQQDWFAAAEVWWHWQQPKYVLNPLESFRLCQLLLSWGMRCRVQRCVLSCVRGRQ